MLVRFDIKPDAERDSVLGYEWFEIVLNVGPFPGGGDMLVVRTEDGVAVFNSNDVVEEYDLYDLTLVPSEGARPAPHSRKRSSKKR